MKTKQTLKTKRESPLTFRCYPELRKRLDAAAKVCAWKFGRSDIIRFALENWLDDHDAMQAEQSRAGNIAKE